MLGAERETVPDVEQRFLMHRFVFENGEHRFRVVEERIAPGGRESALPSAWITRRSASETNSRTRGPVGPERPDI